MGSDAKPMYRHSESVRVQDRLLISSIANLTSFCIFFGNIADDLFIVEITMGAISVYLLSLRSATLSRTSVIWSISHLLFLGVALIGVTGAVDKSTTPVFFRWHLLALFIVWFICRLGEGGLRIFTRSLVTGAVSCAAISVLVALLGASDYVYFPGSHRRLRGFSEHPNQYSILLISMAPLVFNYLRMRPIALLVSLSTLGVAVLMSGSKMGYVIYGVSLVLMAAASIDRFRTDRSMKVILYILAGVAALFGATQILSLLTVINPGYMDALLAFADDPLSSNSYIDRVSLYATGSSLFEQNWLLGIGPNQALAYVQFTHFHNSLLDYAVSFGVVGTAIIAGLICYFLWTMRLAGNGDRAPLFALVVLLIATQSSDSLGARTFCLFAILWALGLRYVVNHRIPTTRGGSL